MTDDRDGTSKSFLVLFPDDPEALEAKAGRLVERRFAGIGRRRPGLHITLHHFHCTRPEARALAAILDAIEPPPPVDLRFDRVRGVALDGCDSGWLSWVLHPDEPLLYVRRALERSLSEAGIAVEPAERWQPHITLLEGIPLDLLPPARRGPVPHPPVRARFDTLRLTRWHGGMDFERAGEWRLGAR